MTFHPQHVLVRNPFASLLCVIYHVMVGTLYIPVLYIVDIRISSQGRTSTSDSVLSFASILSKNLTVASHEFT